LVTASSWLPRGFEFLSGFPERIRREKLILVLQSFYDESGCTGQGRWMSMSGLFATAELFATVADQWDKSLRATDPGRISYFKLSEAMNLSGEFRCWDRDKAREKIRRMARVINRPDLLNVGALLDLHAFARIRGWSHLKDDHSMNRPYMQLFQYVFVSTITEGVDHGGSRPMEIVFDNHDKFRPVIVDGYPELRELERDDTARYALTPLLPGFRDDKDFVMLQAADLVAGQMRLAAEDGEDADFMYDLTPNLRVSKWFTAIGDDELSQINEMILSKHREIILRDDPLD
jgi:hypothetical protein